MGDGVLVEEAYQLIKDDLFRVYERNAEIGGNRHDDPEKFIKERIGNAKTLIKRGKEGKPLGFITYKDEGNFIDFLNLAIHPDIRGSFLGCRVAKDLNDKMETEGKPIRLVILKVETDIFKLALSYGYKIIGGEKYQLILGKE